MLVRIAVQRWGLNGTCVTEGTSKVGTLVEPASKEIIVYPTTPDGRYFVVKQQLWRCSNPSLPPAERESLVADLMAARRAVKQAKRADDAQALKSARARVDEVKVALGERGPVWWDDDSPDYNRRKVSTTPYAQWYAQLPEDSAPA